MAATNPPVIVPGSRSARREAWPARAALILFLGWLFLPMASRWLWHGAREKSARIRETWSRPAWQGRPLADDLRDFTAYFEKSHPLRAQVILLYNACKLYALHVSPVPSVIIGRDRWLFLGQETDRVDEGRYFLGSFPFDETTLERWAQGLQERRRWLESRGIAYWLVVAPNKSTIYPEFLPRIYPRDRATRMDQLKGFLEKRAPGFPLIDLRPVLRAGKSAGLVYWPLDTHWNYSGRNLAYREIARRMSARFPSLKALPEDAFVLVPDDEKDFDLKNLLVLPWDFPGDFFAPVPKPGFAATPARAPGGAAGEGIAIFRSKIAGLRLALFIHDSFGDTLKPLLGAHFRRSRWILDRKHALPVEWIESARPCLVIDEITERYLEDDPWANPEETRG